MSGLGSLFAALGLGAAALANPGMMNPPPPSDASKADTTPNPSSEDHHGRTDSGLDELEKAIDPGCGPMRLSRDRSPLCWDEDRYGDPSLPIVAPPTGSEGSADVLPIIQSFDDGEDADRNRIDQAIEQSNECIGYECNAGPGSGGRQSNGPDYGGDAPAADTGYFNSDFSGRSDVPPKAQSGGALPADTGYFNSDFSGRSDVPPRSPADAGIIPVTVTLTPVPTDIADRPEPPPESDEDDE